MTERFEELERLGKLLDEGKINSEEYARLKKELMDEIGATSSSGAPTSPGWYNDPSGNASHQAYWDGEKWTGATRPDPTTPADGTPPVVTAQQRRSGCGWIIIALIVLIILGAIGALLAVSIAGRTVTESFSQIGSQISSSTTTIPAEEGVPINGLTCPSNLTESSIYDYGEDARGFDTIPQALHPFLDSEGKFHPAWNHLAVVDPQANPVQFENDRDWVVLRVRFTMLNGGWLVETYEACADL